MRVLVLSYKELEGGDGRAGYSRSPVVSPKSPVLSVFLFCNPRCTGLDLRWVSVWPKTNRVGPGVTCSPSSAHR